MMTDDDTPDAASEDAAADTGARRPGERLAKAIARAGLGSRREAEVWIGEGRVSVNGARAETAALNVLPHDRIEVDGRALPARERTRLWLYHKPRGYVTTTHDPEGRETVFSILPADMPRVITIGRLDINTEGLLLLTNDGGLARVLELPETGWLRRYRVRAFGRANPEAVLALKDGVTIDDFAYGAIEAEIERQNNDNVWLRFGLREGKNREVKRVAEHLGLAVNRLIRISFGPFQLGSLPEGGVEEVRSRTLMEQLGKRLTEEAGCDFESAAENYGDAAPRVTGGRGAGRPTTAAAAPKAPRNRLADPSERVGRRAPVARPRDVAAPAASTGEAERPTRKTRAPAIADRRGRTVKVERVARDAAVAEPKRVSRRDPGAAERFGAPGRAPRSDAKSEGRDPRPARRDGPPRERTPRAGEPRGGDRPFRPERPARDGAPRGDKPFRSDRPARAEGGAGLKPRSDRPRDGDRPERRPRDGDRPARPFSPRPPRDGAPSGDRRPRDGDRPDRRPREGDRPARPFSPRPPREGGYTPRPDGDGERPRSGAPRVSTPRWRDDGPGRDGAPRRDGDRPERPSRPGGDRPRGDRPFGDRPPRGDRPAGGAGSRGPARPRADRPADGDAVRGPRAPRGDRPAGDRKPGAAPRGLGGKPGGKPGGFKPRGPGGPSRGPGGKPGGKPGGGKPGGGGRGRPGGADRRR